MLNGQLVFAQLMDYLPRHEFNTCVRRYRGHQRHRGFSCRDQFLTLAFAQLTFRESLRDIETCLNALGRKRYHAGFRSDVSRSTLSDANRVHDWRIYRDFAHVLIDQARSLYANEPLGIAFQNAVYAFDSTTIDLCLSLFPWAQFRRRKGAVKLHTLVDLRGSIPCFIHISKGNIHDVNALDHLSLEAGALYVMDRGYLDFERLHRFQIANAFFVTRAKANLAITCSDRRPVEKATGLRSDQTVKLAGPSTSKLYPEPFRRVAFYDVEHQRKLVFLTNNFELPALAIAQLYRARWRVELFFKWIKQHLRIKRFYGNNENAVKTQIWIAIAVYVLLAIIRKRLDCKRPMSEILQILSITLFEKIPIKQAISTENETNPKSDIPKPRTLFDL